MNLTVALKVAFMLSHFNKNRSGGDPEIKIKLK